MAEHLLCVLFNSPATDINLVKPAPHFGDLNLDQAVVGISNRRSSYSVAPIFSVPLEQLEDISNRQQIFADLRAPDVFESVDRFCNDVQLCLSYIDQSKKLRNRRQKQRWFVDAAGVYVGAVVQLAEDFDRLRVESNGLEAIAGFVKNYVSSLKFTRLRNETADLQARFAEIRYNLLIRANKITVTGYEGEEDFSKQVEQTFERFRQGIGKDYKVRYTFWPDMNRIEEEILDIVVRLNPEVFDKASAFYQAHSNFLDDTILRFDREVQFYLTYIEQMRDLEQLGLEFCYPVLSKEKKEFHIRGGFDLALAQKLARDGKKAVKNDYSLGPDERVIVVSGPNSGGKTTYARAFGQINYLASLGCPVPAREAELFIYDQIFTHFEREEDLDNLRGKLEDELVRIHEILEKATASTLIIMNESFGSTALDDARVLGSKVLEQIIELGATCLCVTFVDELSRISDATVSMVAKVLPEDPTIRTFEIEARPADGLAYASAIAEKYQLGYESVKKRIEK